MSYSGGFDSNTLSAEPYHFSLSSQSLVCMKKVMTVTHFNVLLHLSHSFFPSVTVCTVFMLMRVCV